MSPLLLYPTRIALVDRGIVGLHFVGVTPVRKVVASLRKHISGTDIDALDIASVLVPSLTAVNTKAGTPVSIGLFPNLMRKHDVGTTLNHISVRIIFKAFNHLLRIVTISTHPKLIRAAFRAVFFVVSKKRIAIKVSPQGFCERKVKKMSDADLLCIGGAYEKKGTHKDGY